MDVQNHRHQSEERPGYLLRDISGFLSELVAGHGRIIPGAGRDGDGENLVTDAANDLLGVAMDPNVHIGEYKAATCDIRPGRRPRGPGARRLVEEYRDG